MHLWSKSSQVFLTAVCFYLKSMQLRWKSSKFITLAFRHDTAASLAHWPLFVHRTPYVHKFKRFLTFEMWFCTINLCPQHHDAAVPVVLQNCAFGTKKLHSALKNCAFSTKKLLSALKKWVSAPRKSAVKQLSSAASKVLEDVWAALRQNYPAVLQRNYTAVLQRNYTAVLQRNYTAVILLLQFCDETTTEACYIRVFKAV